MIPRDFIIEWRSHAPWKLDAQIEQDLIISRALVDIFGSDVLRENLAFRGGTALHKLHLPQPLRYSEDLDFIQRDPEAIGATFDTIRGVLDPWLGEPRRELKEGLVKLLYRFETEDGRKAKLKVEINSREHFAAREVVTVPYEINSRWYSGKAQAPVLPLPWLLGSKLRALYQRRKGRDLFDLAVVLQQGRIAPELVVSSFISHLKAAGQSVSRAELEENLHFKIKDEVFLSDLTPLLASSAAGFDLAQACAYLLRTLIAKVPGEPWKGTKEGKKPQVRK
jgi:predicted nucleotidyltransferase component of viral defense system